MTAPTNDLYDGIARAFPLQLFPWDEYFARMAEADFLAGRFDVPAVKSYFVRSAPFNGSYTLLGGITSYLRQINELRFDNNDFTEGMKRMGFREGFVPELKRRGGLRNVTVYAPPEGTPFFPNEPIVSLVGPLGELRLADGMLIEELNFASLSMTKWHRMAHTVRPGTVTDFSRRRSQNHMKASLYGILAGCAGTSNCELARFFDVPTRGTMGHEWMQSFDRLPVSYDTWLDVHPDLPLGLVDTIHCMKVDFPEWLEAVDRHRDAIKKANSPTWGWRNDSGDLAYLTIEQYVTFLKHPLSKDPWFLERMRITLTNDLDEYSSSAIIAQVMTQARAAGLNAEDIVRRIIWAAGTRPGVCYDTPALGGVMKLVECDKKPRIKLALDSDGRVGIKTSIPGFNLSGMVHNGTDKLGVLLYPEWRYSVTTEGRLYDKLNRHDVAVLKACHPDNAALVHELEQYSVEPKQQVVFKDGELTQEWQNNRPTLEGVRKLIASSIDALPWWFTRIEKPHVLPVSVTPDLFNLRERMIRARSLQAEYQPF